MANSLLTGTARFQARSPWPALTALATAIAIQAGMQLLGGVLGAMMAGADLSAAGDASDERRLMSSILVFLALSQLAVVLLTWWAAGLFGGERRAVLQLDGRLPNAREIMTALLGLLIVMGGYNLLVYLIRPDLFMADAAPFRPMLEGNLWPVTLLAVGIGAPLSEELLFRGFLISAMARWRGGFWPAALLANLVWTAFHLGYSAAGLLEVFIGGLYLSWLLWRTGSLWLPILAHAAINIVFLAVLAMVSFQ